MGRHSQALESKDKQANFTPVKNEPKNSTGSNRFASRLFGHDFFISYAMDSTSERDENADQKALKRGTQKYAEELFRKLVSEDRLTVFFSEKSMVAGEEVPSYLKKNLAKSKALIVIVNKGTLIDPRYVRTEVKIFEDCNPNSKIIIVNVGGALDGDELNVTTRDWLKKRELKKIPESEKAVEDGNVSKNVLDEIINAREHRKSETSWKWLKRVVIAVLVLLCISVAIITYIAKDNEKQALLERGRAVSLRLVANSQSLFKENNFEKGWLQLIAADALNDGYPVKAELSKQLIEHNHLKRIVTADKEIASIAISADGKRFASGDDDGALQLWSADTGQPLGKPMVGHVGKVTSISFSPVATSKIVAAGGNDGTVDLWNEATRLSICPKLSGNKNPIRSIQFSPDGKQIVSGSTDGTMRLWDIASCQVIWEQTGHKNAITSVAFSPDGGQIISGGEDNTIRFWEVKNGHSIRAPINEYIDNGYGYLHRLAHGSNGNRFVIAKGHEGQHIWDADTGAPIESMEGHEDISFDSITSVAYSPDGHFILSGSADHIIRLWDAATGKPKGKPITGHTGIVNSVAFSSDGEQFVSGAEDGSVIIWDVKGDHTRYPSFKVQSGSVSNVAASPVDRWILTSGPEKRMYMWNFDSATEEPLRNYKYNVEAADISPNGNFIVTGSDSGILRLFDTNTKKLVGSPIIGHKGSVNSLAFNSDGQQIVSGGQDGKVRVWVADSLQSTSDSWEVGNNVISVMFSQDGKRILSGDADGVMRQWDIISHNLVGEPFYGNHAAYSLDAGQITTVSNEGGLYFWDSKTCKSISPAVENNDNQINSVVFSSDRNFIVAGGYENLMLLNARTGASIGDQLAGFNTDSVSLSSNNRWVLAGGEEAIRVWDLPSRNIVAKYQASGEIKNLKISSDGRWIIFSDFDDILHLWPGPSSWASELCKKLTRNMSHKEWQDWVSKDIDYIEKQCPGLPTPPYEPNKSTDKTAVGA